MPRPCCPRCIDASPGVDYFKPRGVPLSALDEVQLMLDELEAIRLADLEGMHQENAADRMKVSRPTFGRILEAAHRKIAEALVRGKALKIEGGSIKFNTMRTFTCSDCQHTWQVPHGTGRPMECPACRSRNHHRAPVERGRGHRCGGFRGSVQVRPEGDR